MNFRTVLSLAAILVATTSVQAQGWAESYSTAMDACKRKDFASARTAFLAAVALRPEDQSQATLLPGPVTEPQKWRGGAPYSPNFGAAYAAFKASEGAQEPDRTNLLQQAAAGFEALVTKGQASVPTVYYLDKVYGAMGQVEKQRDLAGRTGGGNRNWKVDTGFLPPEESAMFAAQANSSSNGGNSTTNDKGVTTIKAGANTTPDGKVGGGTTGGVESDTSLTGRVPTIPTKYALVIGNSEGQTNAEDRLSFAANDAMLVRDALVQNAGYEDQNVDMVVNGTAEQIMNAAKSLAERVPEDGKVVIFFSGTGVNVSGRDYLVGIDATMSTDTAHMVALGDLYKLFTMKGAKVFAFCEANRTTSNGLYFGRETPLAGEFAQVMGTIPREKVYATIHNGQLVGVFAKAFSDVLAEFRSNAIPIKEFCWAVYNSMKGGSQGVEGAGAYQVPTLPVLRFIPETEKF